VRASGFAVAAQQNRVGSLQKDDFGGDHSPHGFDDFRQLLELTPLADVHYERGALDLGRLSHEFRKSRDQSHGQVVYAVVAEVLEGLENRSFSVPAHPRNNDQLAGTTAIMGHTLVGDLAGSIAE